MRKVVHQSVYEGESEHKTEWVAKKKGLKVQEIDNASIIVE